MEQIELQDVNSEIWDQLELMQSHNCGFITRDCET